MPHGGQAFAEVGQIVRLDRDAASVEEPHARGVEGLLQIHAAIDQIDQDLDMTLRLHISPHAAERHFQPPGGVEDHRWKDRVPDPLPRPSGIGMPWDQHEVGEPVVQYHARSRNDNAAAERPRDAGDE